MRRCKASTNTVTCAGNIAPSPWKDKQADDHQGNVRDAKEDQDCLERFSLKGPAPIEARNAIGLAGGLDDRVNQEGRDDTGHKIPPARRLLWRKIADFSWRLVRVQVHAAILRRAASPIRYLPFGLVPPNKFSQRLD